MPLKWRNDKYEFIIYFNNIYIYIIKMSEFTGFSRDAQALPNSNSSDQYIKQYIENLVNDDERAKEFFEMVGGIYIKSFLN